MHSSGGGEVKKDIGTAGSLVDVQLIENYNKIHQDNSKNLIDIVSAIKELKTISKNLTKIIDIQNKPKENKSFLQSHKENLKSPNVLASVVAIGLGWLGLWIGGVFAERELQKKQQALILKEHEEEANTQKMIDNLSKKGFIIKQKK